MSDFRFIMRDGGSVVHAVQPGQDRSVCGKLATDSGGGWRGSVPARGPVTCTLCRKHQATECRLDMVDGTQILIDRETLSFDTEGARIAMSAIPDRLADGWVEIETVWESFGELEPWQDEDDVNVVGRSRARMRIYRHAVVTASVIYADEHTE